MINFVDIHFNFDVRADIYFNIDAYVFYVKFLNYLKEFSLFFVHYSVTNNSSDLNVYVTSLYVLVIIKN